MSKNKIAAIIGITIISIITFWTIAIPILGIITIVSLVEDE